MCKIHHLICFFLIFLCFMYFSVSAAPPNGVSMTNYGPPSSSYNPPSMNNVPLPSMDAGYGLPPSSGAGVVAPAAGVVYQQAPPPQPLLWYDRTIAFHTGCDGVWSVSWKNAAGSRMKRHQQQNVTLFIIWRDICCNWGRKNTPPPKKKQTLPLSASIVLWYAPIVWPSLLACKCEAEKV